MKRAAALRAWNSTLPASGRIKHRSPRRREREKVFDPYVTWLHAPGGVCVVCGETRNLQGSHVGIGGAGLKHGRACDMVRMCGTLGRREGCHQQWEQRKGRFDGWSFDEREQASIAWRVLHWEAFLDWAGLSAEKLGGGVSWGNGEEADEATAILDCETEIRAALARLAPDRRNCPIKDSGTPGAGAEPGASRPAAAPADQPAAPAPGEA